MRRITHAAWEWFGEKLGGISPSLIDFWKQSRVPQITVTVGNDDYDLDLEAMQQRGL